MKIQIWSDLHLEYNKGFLPINDEEEILVLAGDICVIMKDDNINPEFLRLISYATKCFNFVLFVPGNHEYFGSNISKVDKLLRSLKCKFSNFIFMNNDTVYIDNIAFIGSTLWSYLPSGHEKYKTSDFENINGFTAKEQNRRFSNSHAYVENMLFNITEMKKYKICVITHHAPLIEKTSDPKYIAAKEYLAYASDSSDLVEKADYWIYGHTHYQTDFYYKSCRVISNPFGYPGELKVKKKKVISIN